MAGERNILKGLRTTRERTRRNNLAGNMDMSADINFSGKKASEVVENGSRSTNMVAAQGVSWKKARVVAEAGPSEAAPSKAVPSEAAPSEAVRPVTVTMNSSLLECCVCFGPLIPPLFQCNRGHITSSECRKSMAFQCTRCPPEAAAVTRCHAMERVLGGLMVPCSFHVQGCTKVVPYEGKAEHEKSCLHAVSFCPVPGCRLRRYAGMSLFEHLNKEHPEVTRTCVPFGSVGALQLHEGQTAHAVFLDGGNHEEVYQSVFLLVADGMQLPAPARGLSVFRIMNVPAVQKHEYKFKIQVYAKSGILSLSGQTENVGRLTKPYSARAALIVPAAMWSPEESPVYIEIK